MKKSLIAWALALVLLLCACARTGPSAEIAAPAPSTVILEGEALMEHYAKLILGSQPDGEDYTALDGDDVEFYLTQLYGVPAGSWDMAFIYTAGGVDAREIAMIFGLDDQESYDAATGLEAYRESRVGDFTGYAPDQAAMAEKGLVVTGNRVALLICADPDAALETLRAANAPLVFEPFDPAETPPPPYDWTVYLDEDGYKKFDPPREFDMSLYDDTPIVAAWETGDDSGLDEKQAAILAKCREIFAEVITDGMTDFQKELALHDWLTTHGEYDHTHYDPRTPLGREDNTNPYGMLVKGYGICLGYAESFRLLMDLCGVECVTVPGAAFNSREDHAWNMVKLEGEWYCVDPTWDNSPSHHYFNVTSEYLRQTDHQWDYENTPEATATRFHWEGYGPLPS